MRRWGFSRLTFSRFLLILCFLFPAPLFAYFNSGKKAFDAGGYRTAFSELKTSVVPISLLIQPENPVTNYPVPIDPRR
jgi:hypothetical protein